MLRYLASGKRDFNQWPVPPMPRLNWEFYLVADGYCAPVFPKGRSPELRTHCLWLFTPQFTYGWKGDSKPCSRMVFHYGSVPEELENFMKTRRWMVIDLSEERIRYYQELAATLEPDFRQPRSYSHLHFHRALLDLSLEVLESQKAPAQIPLDQQAHDRVERALAWYVINMARNPKIDEVATSLHISPTHLRRHFKQIKNSPPHKVFRKLQIQRATELMATTPDTLDLIAERCGFQSSSDFSRVFRREMGVGPDNWRKAIIRKDFSALEQSTRHQKG